jgi:hypothetical protein
VPVSLEYYSCDVRSCINIFSLKFIIIIIIIRHELALIGLFWPRVTVSLKVFQVVFFHLVYNSAFLFLSFCCSFLLHDVDKFVCIFLVSCQLVLLSTVTKFLHSFCGKKGVPGSVFLKTFISIYANLFYPFFLRVQNSLPFKEWGEPLHYVHTFILENFWTKVALNVLFRIPSI